MLSTKNLKISPQVQEILAMLQEGAQECLVLEELAQKLQISCDTNTPLRIKLGMDPTAADLHLGHTVVLNKMRQWQTLGHQVIFLIGDFTALIGDPSGRNTTRPALTREEITENAQTYFSQVSCILDPQNTEIRYNAEWLEPLGARGMLMLAGQYTVARLLERDDFTQRFQSNQAISLHELLYPLVQGYDSVALKSDVELGGSDQKFNLLVGRELQKNAGQAPQCILTMPLLEGIDGTEKMSKSKGNTIGITEPANSMFAKIMRLSDSMMWRYYDLISFVQAKEIAIYKQQVATGANPRDFKIQLAQEIVCRFHDKKAAEAALTDFQLRAQGGIPEHIPEITLSGAPLLISKILRETQLCTSASEGVRLIAQGGIRLDGAVIRDPQLLIAPGQFVLQVGKRKFARVTLIS